MKYWEIIADNLSKAGWSWGCVSAIDSNGRTIWIADAHRGDGKRFVVRKDKKAKRGQSQVLTPLLCAVVKTIGDMRPGSHVQILRDPSQTDRCFLTQPARQRHLNLITFSPSLQLRSGPTASLKLLLHDPPRASDRRHVERLLRAGHRG